MPAVDSSPRDTAESTVESPPALIAFSDAAEGFCGDDFCAMPAGTLGDGVLSADDEY